MKILWKFIIDSFVWVFCKAWPIWFLFAFIVPPFFIVYMSLENSDRYLNYYGLILELLGSGTVVLGLMGRWKLFGLPDFFKELWNQRPRWNQKPHHATHAGTGGAVFGGSSESSGWHPPQPDSSIEVRLTLLEENVKRFYDRFNNMDKKLKQEERRVNDALNLERQTREKSNKEFKTTLHELGAGGLKIEVFGIYWLFLGMIFSTIPQETACTVKRLIQLVI